MIATFLAAPLIAQIAFVVGGLSLLVIAALLLWGHLWPLNPDYQCECCADDLPPCLKENCDGR